MSTYRKITARRNLAFNTIQESVDDLKMAAHMPDTYTDWELRILDESIHSLELILANKEFGSKGMKIKSKVLEAIARGDLHEEIIIK